MSIGSQLLKKWFGAPEINLAKTPLGAIIGQSITAPVAKQIAEKLPDEELNALYTAVITKLLKRQRAQEQAKQ